jgi:N-acetylglucosamine-6-phosphate deacetylase
MISNRTAERQPLIIQHATIITPYRCFNGDIVVEDGRITEIQKEIDFGQLRTAQVIDASGLYASPGFIDLHTHGGGGADYMDGTVEAFSTAAKTHLAHGTTSIMPTTLSGTVDETLRCIQAYESVKDLPGHPTFLGLHLEGPYFSMAQRGAQDPTHIRNPEPSEYLRILDSTISIKRWSVAPELPGAMAMGRLLAKRGILASIAHTNTDYDTILEAMDNGYSLLTHFYSGMSGVYREHAYRHAGVIEAGYLIDDLPVEVIADGKHLPGSLLALIYKSKGASNICLVTDSIRATGLGEGTFMMGSLGKGQEVIVEDGVAKLPDRTAFAGSIATAEVLVRTMHALGGVPLLEAVRMMTVNPARIAGVNQTKGKLAVGYDADIVLFDKDINIKTVIARGKIVSVGKES